MNSTDATAWLRLRNTRAARLLPPVLFLALAALLAQVSPAQTITDNFTDPANWGTPLVAPAKNFFVGSGRMNFTSTTSGDGGAIIPRNTPILPTTQDWSLKVDVHVDPFIISTQDQGASVFLGVGKTDDLLNTYVILGFDRDWWYPDFYGVNDDVRSNGLDAPGLFNVNYLPSPDAALRLDYSAANHTITYYCDSDGAGNGDNWVVLGTANIASGTYDLQLSPSDTFTIILAGWSGLQAVAPGQAYLSNLEIAVNMLPPAITSQPISRTNGVGSTATFTVAATGTATLSYQWRFNGTNLTDGVNISGSTAATLVLTSVQTNDAGLYSVIITNAAGSATSSAANLTVLPAAYAAAGVIAWGSNSAGQTNVPAGLSNVVAVAAGGYHSLALQADGFVVGWGDNSYGQAPAPVGLSNVVAVAGGHRHSLALMAERTVAAWGQYFNGSTYVPMTVPVDLSNVVAVAAGGFFNLALRADGTVAAWGNNQFGQTNLPANLSNIVAVAAGGFHCLALRADGTVTAWGATNSGQTSVPTDLTNVVAVAGGQQHSLALRADGTVAAWGTSFGGPPNALSGLSNVVAVGAGGFHSLALQADGTVTAWAGAFGSLFGQTNMPVGLTHVVAVAASGAAAPDAGAHSLALVGSFQPTIFRQPASSTNHAGTTASFSVAATGIAPLTYQWRFNGTNLPGQTGANFVLPGVTTNQAGSYAVVVINAFGSVTSSVATLTITPAADVVLKQWDKVLGGSGNDLLNDVRLTSDGGFIAAGYSDSPVGPGKAAAYGDYDYWVVKCDASGNVQWERTFGGDKLDYLYSALPLRTGGYLLAGFTASGATGNKTVASFGDVDIWLIRLDGNGNRLWERVYGGSARDEFGGKSALIETGDGGFLVAGNTRSPANTGNKTSPRHSIGSDFWVLKLDSSGLKEWEQTYYNGGTVGAGMFVHEAVDAHFVAGATGVMDYTPWSARVGKATGALLTPHSYGGGFILLTGLPLSDGGYWLAGYSYEAFYPNPSFWLTRVDAFGNFITNRMIGGLARDTAQSLAATSEGGFLAGGESFSPPGGDRTAQAYGSDDYWLVKFDDQGGIIWDKAYGGTGYDFLSKVLLTPDGGILLGGYSNSDTFPAGGKSASSLGLLDYWIIRLTMTSPPVLPSGIGLYLTNAIVSPDGRAHFEVVTPSNGVYSLLVSTNLSDWFSVDNLEGPTNRFTLTWPDPPWRVNDFNSLFLRVAVGLVPQYDFRLNFHSTAGTLVAGTPIVSFPQSVQRYSAFLEGNRLTSPAAATDVFFTGPPGSGLTNALPEGSELDPDHYGKNYWSPIPASPSVPPPGTWTVNYAGTLLVFDQPDAQTRFVIPHPTVVVSNGVLASVNWVYRDPTTGQPLAGPPGFLTVVVVEVFGGAPSQRIYDSGDLGRETANHPFSPTIDWSEVDALTLSYYDNLGNYYEVRYAK